MEHQTKHKFDSLIQDTIFRLQHCMEILDEEPPESCDPAIESSPEQSSGAPSSSRDASENSKKRAKRARRNARKKEQRKCVTDENTNDVFKEAMNTVQIESYSDETQLASIIELIGRELSEPYSVYTYRYFVNTWPELTLLAYDTISKKYIGVIICKVDVPGEVSRSQNDEDENESLPRGYIAMLAVDETHRGRGIGTRLVESVTERIQNMGCGGIILETEVSNTKALNLYSRLGFIRERRLYRYYLNGSDAFRLAKYLR